MNTMQTAGLVTPALGTRFTFTRGSTRRVYELVASATPEAARAAGQHGCDRHTLRVVEESGYLPEHAAGIGSEIHVEDAWFTERTDAKRLPARAA
jgi:hypothetical protein